MSLLIPKNPDPSPKIRRIDGPKHPILPEKDFSSGKSRSLRTYKRILRGNLLSTIFYIHFQLRGELNITIVIPSGKLTNRWLEYPQF